MSSPPKSKKSKSFLRKPLDHSTHFAARFGAAYFITICCGTKGQNQLCHKQIAEQVFRTAKLYDHRGLWYLELMLLMPDHLHALIAFDGESSLSNSIANFKRATTKFAGVRWQRNFFDHRLRNDESSEEKAEYIRCNPVRAGLVTAEEDWPYVLDREQIEMAVR
jgi:putative transposase